MSSDAAVAVEHIGKRYRIGTTTGTGRYSYRSLREDVTVGLRSLGRRGQKDDDRTIWALRDVSFEIEPGERVGIIGRNGAGKSTLLKLLSRITQPTEGQGHIRGRVGSLLEVGTGFHPELTGTENVTLFASSLRIPRDIIRERMDAVTAFAELDQHMDTPIKRFSSGMISRLSFAIAMQFPADIYVFDEVLAVVDGEFQARCLAAIKKLRDAGSTIFFVSHNLDQVAEVCDRVMWLERGSVREIGPTAAVLDAYRHVHMPEHD